MRLSISIAFLFRCRGSPPAAPRPDAIRCAFARLAINRGGAIRPQVSATLTTVKDGTGLWADDGATAAVSGQDWQMRARHYAGPRCRLSRNIPPTTNAVPKR